VWPWLCRTAFSFRGGAEGRIRQRMIEDNILDAIVGLPANLFPTTSIPVAILIFDRSREKGGPNEKRRDVLFIDASRDYQPGKTGIFCEKTISRRLSPPIRHVRMRINMHMSPPSTEIKENSGTRTPGGLRPMSLQFASSRLIGLIALWISRLAAITMPPVMYPSIAR